MERNLNQGSIWSDKGQCAFVTHNLGQIFGTYFPTPQDILPDEGIILGVLVPPILGNKNVSPEGVKLHIKFREPSKRSNSCLQDCSTS